LRGNERERERKRESVRINWHEDVNDEFVSFEN